MKSKLSSSDLVTDPNQPDLSILRTPIGTSVTGFLETIQAYENGTGEVSYFFFFSFKLVFPTTITLLLVNFISSSFIFLSRLEIF